MNRTTLMLLALLFVALGSCFGCASLMRPQAFTRTVDAQGDATLALVVHCTAMPAGMSITGSGVAISKTEALTAAHVVACQIPDPQDPTHEHMLSLGALDSILAFQPDGIGRPMKVALAAPNTDVARLAFVDDGEFYGIKKTTIAAVRVGTRVCIMPASPHRDRRCGEVEFTFLNRRIQQLAISTPVEPGNSGSAVYDARGRLVGIVTRQRIMENGQSTGGLATALRGREWITFAALEVAP